LTIDQLGGEANRIQQIIISLKQDFARNEQENLKKYGGESGISSVHQAIFESSDPDLNEQSLIQKLQESNSKNKKAISDLEQAIGSSKTESSLDQVVTEHRLQESRKKFVDKMIDIVGTPWTINQCLMTNQYPQATQLIISFEYAFPSDDDGESDGKAAPQLYPLLI
jgi:hypothetical protein